MHQHNLVSPWVYQVGFILYCFCVPAISLAEETSINSDAIHGEFDTNHDGVLDKAEFKAYLLKKGTAETKLFQQLDSNGDDIVTKQDVLKTVDKKALDDTNEIGLGQERGQVCHT